jgi:hypothetical protein
MKKSKILFVLILLISNVMFSQTDFGDDVEDVPAAPIDGWIFVVLAVGVYYGYRCTISNKQKVH